jgi:hypothetical protein
MEIPWDPGIKKLVPKPGQENSCGKQKFQPPQIDLSVADCTVHIFITHQQSSLKSLGNGCDDYRQVTSESKGFYALLLVAPFIVELYPSEAKFGQCAWQQQPQITLQYSQHHRKHEFLFCLSILKCVQQLFI